MKSGPQKPLGYDDDDDLNEFYDEMFSVASTMECTGLIPNLPRTKQEVDNYQDIYDIPLGNDSQDAQKTPPQPPQTS